MTAFEVVALADRLGVSLSARAGRLVVDAPAGLADRRRLIGALTAHKAEVMDLLAGRAGQAQPPMRRSWLDLPDMSPGPRDYRKGDR